jgi:DNA polymerase-3 subunit gamma/tau
VVTAQDGTTIRTYTVIVTRLTAEQPSLSNDATLSGLVLSSGALSPNFASGTTSYTATVDNSVDNIREIRDEVVYAPSQARYKVYIIDEVHMLSSGAFNALLKTLEEPPQHVVFILATTDPHKLPATILSRCQRFDFKKITPQSIAGRIEYIAGESGINLEHDAAMLIARLADGAMRDALSILDQCVAVGNKDIYHQDVLDIIGIVSDDFIADMVDDIQNADTEGLVRDVEKLSSNGRDILRFASDLVLYYRNLLMCKLSSQPESILDVSRDFVERMKRQAEKYDKSRIIAIIRELSSFEAQLKYALNQRVFLEVMLISISSGSYGQSSDNDALLDRIETLEHMIQSGAAATGSVQAPVQAQTIAQHQAPATVSAEAQMSTFSTAASVTQPGNSTVIQDSADKLAKKKKIDSLEQLDEWPAVMQELRKSGRMMLATYLAQTKAVAADESVVIMFFQTRFRL